MTIQPYQYQWFCLFWALFFSGVGWNEAKIYASFPIYPPEKGLPLLWDADFKKHFPVAIISGTLEAYDSDSGDNPVKLSLRVIDQISKKEQEWIYNPAVNSGGAYKMFLRPNRTYEISIIPLKEGYKEHKTQIYIPRSTYSYEFSRKLRLEALKSVSGEVIATKISVVQSSHSFTNATEIARSSAYYDGLIDIAITAIERSDSVNFTKLVHAGHIPDTLNEQVNLKMPESNPRYDKLVHTIESAIEEGNWEPIDSLIETSELLNDAFISEKLLDERMPIRSESFHFDRSSALTAPKDAVRLKELAQIFKNSNKKLILQINGYSDADGSDEHNDALSKQRAVSILQILKKYQVKPSDFILILNGYGAVKTDDPQKGRRADVNIYELP